MTHARQNDESTNGQKFWPAALHFASTAQRFTFCNAAQAQNTNAQPCATFSQLRHLLHGCSPNTQTSSPAEVETVVRLLLSAWFLSDVDYGLSSEDGAAAGAGRNHMIGLNATHCSGSGTRALEKGLDWHWVAVAIFSNSQASVCENSLWQSSKINRFLWIFVCGQNFTKQNSHDWLHETATLHTSILAFNIIFIYLIYPTLSQDKKKHECGNHRNILQYACMVKFGSI